MRIIFQLAILCSIVATLGQAFLGKKGAYRKMLTPIDFIPNFGGEEAKPQQQSIKEMKAIFMAFAKSHNRKLDKLEAKGRLDKPIDDDDAPPNVRRRKVRKRK